MLKDYYYELVEPWEPELVGVKDGSSQAIVFEKGFKNKQNYRAFMEVFANPNYFSPDEALKAEFDIECVRLKKGAILTDFLSFSPMSYTLVSDKVYNILNNYSLGNHRFFTARVQDVKGNSIEGYRFFYTQALDWNIIDFPHCEFMKGNEYDGYKAVWINSREEFLRDRFVKVRKVALTNIPGNADIFKLKLPVRSLISTSLYQEFESAKVTGIKFKKIEVEVRGSST